MYYIEYESGVQTFLNSLQASTNAKIARFVGIDNIYVIFLS